MYAHVTIERQHMTALSTTTLRSLVLTTELHLRQTKAAYQSGMDGITYDDMSDAAKRVLTARRTYEKAAGKKVISNPDSKAQVVGLLR